MKKVIVWCTALVLLLGSGCTTFRKMFDKKPEKKVRKSERKAQEKRSSDDPLFHLLYNTKNDRPGYLEDSKLSRTERDIVNKSFGTPGRHRDPDVLRAREDLDSGRQKRKDWVFGTKDGEYF